MGTRLGRGSTNAKHLYALIHSLILPPRERDRRKRGNNRRSRSNRIAIALTLFTALHVLKLLQSTPDLLGTSPYTCPFVDEIRNVAISFREAAESTGVARVVWFVLEESCTFQHPRETRRSARIFKRACMRELYVVI